MASGNEGETGPAAESNEHDYAHSTFTPEPSSCGITTEPQLGAPIEILSEEIPEPAVGAEVDWNEVEVQIPVESDLRADSEFTAAASPDMPRRGLRRLPRRPQDKNCSCCKLLFQRQGRSFNRRAVYTFTTPETVHWLFPESEVNDKSFLCETCAQIIRSKGQRKQSGKRSLWLKPPTKTVKGKAFGRRMGKRGKAALLIGKASYKAAFHTLWSAKGARKPMIAFWSKQMKTEMKALSRQTGSPFHQKVSGQKPLSSFPWRRCLNWAQEKAPLVITCLRSMFPDVNTLCKRSHQLTEEQAMTLLERRTVLALSIPLFTRNIWRNNFLQAALGAELRLQGCSGSALDTLNTMGLCQNKDTVRLLIHRIQNGKDADEDQGLLMKHQQLKQDMIDEEDEDEEEDEEEMELEEDVDEEEDESEDVEEMVMSMKEDEPVEHEEVQVVLEEEEEEPAAIGKGEKKRKKKKAKKQRKEEKRKERGKRKVREEQNDDEDGSEQKKRKVVVVRLGLLKGTSEVGRSDLSAP